MGTSAPAEARLDAFRELVDAIRPANLNELEEPVRALEMLTAELATDDALRMQVQQGLVDVFARLSHTALYTLSGIQGNTSFFGELYKRISYRVLPELEHERDVLNAIRTVFWKRTDHLWLEAMPREQLLKLLQQLTVSPTQSPRFFHHSTQQLVASVALLCHRITALGLEPELVSKVPDMDGLNSPFLQLDRVAGRYLEAMSFSPGAEDVKAARPDALFEALNRCENLLERLRSQKNLFGTSLWMTYNLQRLMQQIERVRRLLEVLHTAPSDRRRMFLELFLELVRNENHRNSLRGFVGSNTGMLAYQVVENAAQHGENYITTTRREYVKMLRNAMGGGFIVGFLSFFKTLYSYANIASFGTTFLYSFNYAAGFIGLYVSGFTLATKQPAMTASRIAQALEGTRDALGRTYQGSLASLAVLIARVSRSQFVAVLGNVSVAFPVAVLLAYATYSLLGSHFLTPSKTETMLTDINPVESLAVLHAAIAGLWLFVSGIVAGYYDNKVIYNRIPERLRRHRPLRKLLGAARTERLAGYLRRHLGGLMGNLTLGILLGSTGTLGSFLGLPLDIRHVTFSAANFGLVVVARGGNLSAYEWAMSLLGIALIGITNLAVSFGLALFVATRSRGVKLRGYGQLGRLVRRHFLRNPSHFFFPPRKTVEANTLQKEN